MFRQLLSLSSVALLTGLLGTSAGTAQAGQPYACCHYKAVVCYETITTYEIRKEPYTVPVTRYDECGRPYTVNHVCYREVKVPITKVVPVTKYVPVCD